MEVDMNTKLNSVSTATMLVLSVLALLLTSSVAAQPIIVDGDESDWDPSWFLAPDITGEIGTIDQPYFENGYDICGVWQHYNVTEDKLYFRYDVVGIAGDSDGNNDPNTLGFPKDQHGVGAQESYRVQLNITPGGDADNYFDLLLYFTDNMVITNGLLAGYTNGDAAIDLTSPFSHTVEFSVDNVSGWLPNPYKYSLYGWAGSGLEGLGEDHLDEIMYVTFPPVANFTFIAGDCNQNVWFDPSGSYDDPFGGIVSYTWDFDDGTGEEVRYDNSSFSHTFPDTHGAYNVNLTVTDTDDLTGSLVREVIVNREPTISDVTANKTEVDPAGGWVRFTGTGSDPDDDQLAYEWSVTNASGTYTIGTGTFTTSYPSFSGAIDYFVSVNTAATLTVTDPYDCTDTDSATVGVKLLCPLPHADADGPYRACVGDLVRFDGSGSSSEAGYHITEYCWDVDNDSVYEYCGSNPVYEHTYPGVYFGNAVLKVTNICGSDIDTAQVVVEECAEEVPILTPAGILGLLGLLCIAGAGRIMRRK
jgi:hypothetical protein